MLARERDALLINRQRLGAELRRLRELAGWSGANWRSRWGLASRRSHGSSLGRNRAQHTGGECLGGCRQRPPGAVEKLLILDWTRPIPRSIRGTSHCAIGLIFRMTSEEIEEPDRNQAGLRAFRGAGATAEPLSTLAGFSPCSSPPTPTWTSPSVVAGRLDRQIALFDESQRFGFLITETALRLRVGPLPVMLGQLDRIRSLSTLENVSIGLIPQDAQVVTHVPHGFVIFESADRETVDALVLVETVHANLTVSERGHVELYRRQWSLLDEMAVYEAEASELLATIATDLRRASRDGSS